MAREGHEIGNRKKRGKMKKIILQARRNFGKKIYHPICDISKLIALLRNSRTTKNPSFREKDLEMLKAIGAELGFEIEFVPWIVEV